MAVSKTYLFDKGLEYIMDSSIGTQWDDSGAAYCFALYTANNAPARTMANKTAVDGTLTEVTGGNYAQIPCTTRTVAESSNEVFFDSDNAAFGADTTIDAKWLICYQGTAGALSGSNVPIFWVDLDDTSGSSYVSSNASTFTLNAPTGGWFKITQTQP